MKTRDRLTMEPQQPQFPKPSRSSSPFGPPASSPSSSSEPAKMAIQASPHSDNDRSNGELRALDCNLASLCDHIQSEGFNSGAFSDVVVHAMGSTYHLHRLVLSRSPYFRNMLHGPWKEASAPTVNLLIDDNNVNAEAIEMALAYLYGHHPKLNDNNAFRVLAAASFLDLQDLCAICTDFIISELWTSNFLAYQVFAESQDYGIHGERVRNACWGYLCQSGSVELKEVLSKLSSQTLHALLTSDELWVPSEEARFELALYAFLAKCAHCKQENSEQGSDFEVGMDGHSDSSTFKGKSIIESSIDKRSESELGVVAPKDVVEGPNSIDNLLADLGDSAVDYQFLPGASSSGKQVQESAHHQSRLDSGFICNSGGSSLNNSFSNTNSIQTSYSEMSVGASGLGSSGVVPEGPSDEGSSFHLNNNDWIAREEYPRNCSSMNSSSNELIASDWGRCSMPPLSWGGRTVGKRQIKGLNSGGHGEEYDGFVNIFEGGSLLYCNMSFEALLNVRKQLEELGFPCKAVNDGLWLQMLLSQRVQEIGADTCKSCCFMSTACVCRQPFGFSHGVATSGYYMQEHDQNNSLRNMGNVYVAESAPGEGPGNFRPVRVHVRSPIDGLAGIGRGNTFVPATAWPPTRFVFSRVPFGMGNRNCQQSPANDDSEGRIDHNGDVAGDGLTALVGLSQGASSSTNIAGEQTERAYEMDLQNRMSGTSISATPTTGAISVPVIHSSQQAIGVDWENTNSSSISLDIKTPLSHFPPFRFGVQFEDVHRLSDSQVKHSPEVFYAGSFWKVSVQAFNDEDPQERRTLGLFLHRRKAEITESSRKVHMYVDSREKVTARYQLICPSKREVMVFGSFKQPGTLLPKAPKGWGWRTALLFDELPDLLQNGALRVAAVIQLV